MDIGTKINNDTKDNSTKIGISSPEDVMLDSSFAEYFIKYLSGKNEAKTISWFEYESM